MQTYKKVRGKGDNMKQGEQTANPVIDPKQKEIEDLLKLPGLLEHSSASAVAQKIMEITKAEEPPPRMCYFVMQTQANDNGEYNALIAVEGEHGYHKTDWYWGKDFALAQECADSKNYEGGISKIEALKIVAGTMRKVS
jgi:hypothetical protein